MNQCSALCPGAPHQPLDSASWFTTAQNMSGPTLWYSMAHTQNRAAWFTQCWQWSLLHTNPLSLKSYPGGACAEAITGRAPPVEGGICCPWVSPSVRKAFMLTSQSYDHGLLSLCKLPLPVLPLENPVSCPRSTHKVKLTPPVLPCVLTPVRSQCLYVQFCILLLGKTNF